MHPPSTSDLGAAQPRPLFLTTRWSMVLNAKNKASPGSREALESLCQAYWYPIYAFVRGMGRTPPDAEDLTQEFFRQFLTKDFLRVVRPEKGRFRTFLRMALKRFLAKEWGRARALKRGGGSAHFAFDTVLAEERLELECPAALAPDQIYDRRWALALLDEATVRLENEYRDDDKSRQWVQLKPYLTAERGSINHSEIALALGLSEASTRVAVHRLRKRFREVFRETIADTVATPGEVDGELRLVIEILSDG